MRRFLTIVLAVALGALASGACGGTVPDDTDELQPSELLLKNQVIRSSAMKRDMKYTVWLPEGAEPRHDLPFLYLLHGYGDDNNAWADKGDLVAIVRNYVASGGKPMVIVMPDALTSFYTGDFETYLHNELMPQVEKAYRCNGKRAVAGLSMGGYGTIYNVLNHPGKFTCGYAMSPATSFGAVDLAALAKGEASPATVPHITLESGTEDYVVGIDSVREFAAVLEAAGIRHELIERSGAHTWPFWQGCLPKALKKAGESF